MEGRGECQAKDLTYLWAITDGETTIAKTAQHIAQDLARLVTFAQRHSPQNVDGKEEERKICKEPSGEEGRAKYSRLWGIWLYDVEKFCSILHIIDAQGVVTYAQNISRIIVIIHICD